MKINEFKMPMKEEHLSMNDKCGEISKHKFGEQ